MTATETEPAAVHAPGTGIDLRRPQAPPSAIPAKLAYARELAESLLAKVAAGHGGCWIWTGARSGGYGVVSVDGRLYRAHRVAYVLAYGEIADGLHIDHLCRVRACIRPDHLEAVTQAENNRRAGEARTHCAAGHALPPREPGTRRRQCPTCKSEYDRQRYAIKGRE